MQDPSVPQLIELFCVVAATLASIALSIQAFLLAEKLNARRPNTRKRQRSRLSCDASQEQMVSYSATWSPGARYPVIKVIRA